MNTALPALSGKRVAIVHDWLVAYAGADRVVDQLRQVFPDAPIYALVYDPKAYPPHFREYDVRTTYVQRIPFATKLYKNMLTLMPGAFEQLDLSEYDVIISSSSSCSKGVITRPDAVHICYCHTPIRYVWNFYSEYFRTAGWFKRLVMPGRIHNIRMWDYLAAQRVDWFIANSNEVAARIRKYYRRDAAVIFPGVRMSDEPVTDTPDDYYLMVGRFTYYKRFDLGVAACAKLGKRLIVVGKGGEERRLRALGGKNVEFRGSLSDAEISALCARAKAFIFPGEEDFGMAPVEAQSVGCPVLAFGRGGALDTVRDGETGLLFREQTVEAVCDCIQRFEREGVALSRSEIRRHAQQFSEERFRREIAAFVSGHLDPAAPASNAP